MVKINFSDFKKNMSEVVDYPAFNRENRFIVNRYINTVLWFCILTGPAIFIGIKLGIFTRATISTCLFISAVMLFVSAFHTVIIKKWPYSEYVGIFALSAMDFLLIYMVYNHVHIHITWFFVPFLGILFFDSRIFIIVVLCNYAAMSVATWLISPHNASINNDFFTAHEYYTNAITGYTIETIVMLVGGLALIKILNNYFSVLITKSREARENAERLNEQMKILFTMAEVYDNVNLIDLKTMTEMSLSDQTYRTHELDFEKHAHTVMTHAIKKSVDPEHLEAFLDFTNLRTLEERLTGKRFIYGEFINTETGWFRAQYINVESYDNGVPYLVVYTVQNINMDKRREEDLIRISLTDELTQLLNRRNLDKDMARYNDEPLEDNFVIASIDINRLKAINDSMGHDAGDELICAAADCLTSAIGDSGKVYRIGGDEFVAVLFTYDIQTIDNKIHEKAAAWHGRYCDTLAVSIGYASHREYPDASIDELRKTADSIMYENKTRYYRENGYERRGRV